VGTVTGSGLVCSGWGGFTGLQGGFADCRAEFSGASVDLEGVTANGKWVLSDALDCLPGAGVGWPGSGGSAGQVPRAGEPADRCGPGPGS
jgi:hypothetical protein